MPTDQLENPKGHANAPHGEIRERPVYVLRNFTMVIAAAMALPVLALIAVGLDMRQGKILGAGIVLLIALAIAGGAVLWKMMASRSTHLVDAEQMEREKRI